MADLKTKPTKRSVNDFLMAVTPEWKREDCFAILRLMEKVTGEKAVMWGPTIVGFGRYHYKYESGHEGTMCVTGFAPRAGNIALYVMGEFDGREKLFEKLGKHKATKGCLYINKLADVDMIVMEKIIRGSVVYTRKKWPQ